MINIFCAIHNNTTDSGQSMFGRVSMCRISKDKDRELKMVGVIIVPVLGIIEFFINFVFEKQIL